MKICYLSHIDWKWIKQRPQFLAEGLANENSVDYYYFPLNKKSNSEKRTDSKSINFYKLIKLPLSGRLPILKCIQKIFNTNRVLSKKYDVVWFCSPEVLTRVNIKKIKVPVIYDCMDDMIENHKSPGFKSMLLNYEKQLLELASIVFVSSNSLKQKMIVRGCEESKIVILYNATNLDSLLGGKKPALYNPTSNRFTITYFGTIASWIDVDLINKILDDEELSNVHVRMIGPVEKDLIGHERLEILKPVPHNKLLDICSDTDLFILPFVLNEITLSVDPVKLYEYIAMNRNITAKYYPELDRYSDYINFYNDFSDLKNIIKKFDKSRELSYSTIEANKFCSENTWQSRSKLVNEALSLITNQ